MVKIISHASRPHLVQLYQNGKVVCDENCPMWTSHKICSHCVAVAHCLDCTQDFIGWFTSHSKKLNLTKLCTSKVMQNIGKKPSQNHYSQRKAKPPILSWALHSSFPSPSTTTINALFYDGPCASSTGVPFGYLQEPTYPNWWSSYSYQLWGVEMPTTSMLIQNFSLSIHFVIRLVTLLIMMPLLILPLLTLYHQRMIGIHFGSASSTNALQPVLDVEVNSQEQLMEVCQLHL